jgi:DNA-directed RNA polymerase specialized sigma24 family protein
MERTDERGQLEAALRALPVHQRIPLVLFHFEDASYEEISSTLGVSLAKVKSDIHRGREALRKVLEARRPLAMNHAEAIGRQPGTTGRGHGSR